MGHVHKSINMSIERLKASLIVTICQLRHGNNRNVNDQLGDHMLLSDYPVTPSACCVLDRST